MRATQNVYIFIHAMHVDVFIKNTLDDNVIKMLRCIHIEREVTMSGWVHLHWAHMNLEDPDNQIMEFTHTYHYVEDETE
jgi:hypothetical protein